MRAFALALIVFAGCRSEGGLSFSYALYLNDGVTPARNCADVGVAQIRVIIGSDLDGDSDLAEDEYGGRAIDDCNQNDRDGNGVLTPDELGVFETAIDRLPAGDYDHLVIELPTDEFGDIGLRFHSQTSFASGIGFYSTDGPLFEVREHEVTRFTFTTFTGGYEEARIVIQPR